MISMDNQSIPPSAYGFKTILPRTRYERVHLKDKVALERDRINQRVGWQAREHQKNAPPNSSLLTQCEAGSAGYLDNTERFHNDIAGEEYQRRQAAIQRRKQIDEARRIQNARREEERWQFLQQQQELKEQYYEQLRETGIKAKKNESLAPYDILSLQYNNDVNGQKQKFQDDLVQYRSAVRAHKLVVQGDTRASYNIINGSDRPTPIPPSLNNFTSYNPQIPPGSGRLH